MRTATKALILRSLASGPKTAGELAEEIGVARRNINIALRHLEHDGKVFQCGWKRSLGTSGDCKALWSFGKKLSATIERPVPMRTMTRVGRAEVQKGML